jgi:hypothetical protein
MHMGNETRFDIADAERQRRKDRELLEGHGLTSEAIDVLLGSRRDGDVFYVKVAPSITVGGVLLKYRPLLLLLDEEM